LAAVGWVAVGLAASGVVDSAVVDREAETAGVAAAVRVAEDSGVASAVVKAAAGLEVMGWAAVMVVVAMVDWVTAVLEAAAVAEKVEVPAADLVAQGEEPVAHLAS